jgi:hypothetical protein
MGTFRLIMKPIMLCIEQVVTTTPTQSDDAFWAKIKASKPYKWFTIALDYIASIKLPKA